MHHIKATTLKLNGKQKALKGFSINELKAAGMSKQQAFQAGIPVDPRRKSEHESNVNAIKAHSTKKPKA
jgi:ribosomal protein L13E